MKWILLGLFIILSIVGYFLYNSYIKKITYNPNNEFVKSDKLGQLMLFYAAWCPYSKTTLDQWYTYKEKYNGNYNISFSEIDCDKHTNLADNYKIESYPTIILLKGDKKYIYDANLNEETLDLFINTNSHIDFVFSLTLRT